MAKEVDLSEINRDNCPDYCEFKDDPEPTKGACDECWRTEEGETIQKTEDDT